MFMKNVSLGLNAVLLVAVIVLYVLHFTGGKSTSADGMKTGLPSGSYGKIVYINIDSLLTDYAQSRELNEAYLKKMEANRTELNVKVRQWSKDAENFQRTMENNGFLTRERADREYADIMIRKETLEKLEQEMTETAIREQRELNQKLYNILVDFLTEYNKTRGYAMVLSTTLGGNVFYAEKGLNITREVVDELNARYAAKK